MSKNLIAAMANDAYDQLQKCKTARGADRERESKLLDDHFKAAQIIDMMADKELELLSKTGFLTDETILVDRDELKLVNAKRNISGQPKKQPLLDEFVK